MKIVWIGGGNMAAALIGGWLKAAGKPQDITVLEINAERRAELARHYQVAVTDTPTQALTEADLWVLAVKPQHMQSVCAQLRPYVANAPSLGAVLSIAAGIRMAQLTHWLDTERIVRAMPNTPALIGEGISGLTALSAVSQQARGHAQALLEAAGPVLWFEQESQLDIVTALSGSGPAYVFYIIEALIQAGMALGLNQDQARQLTVHTVIGAGKLAQQSTEAVSTLRERVTSKGGTTAAGLAVLTKEHVDEALVQAVHAAHQRAQELGAAIERN